MFFHKILNKWMHLVMLFMFVCRLDSAYFIGVAALRGRVLPLTPEEMDRRAKAASASLLTQQTLSQACSQQIPTEGRSTVEHSVAGVVTLDGLRFNCSSGYIHVSDGR
jgi:hypothetical protein